MQERAGELEGGKKVLSSSPSPTALHLYIHLHHLPLHPSFCIYSSTQGILNPMAHPPFLSLPATVTDKASSVGLPPSTNHPSHLTIDSQPIP